MPRRKKNNASRNENKDPALDESLLPSEADDKMLKKESYLRDFDIQVKDRIKAMENQVRKILAELNRLASTEKLKINKEIRTMTIKEFLEKGGDLDTLNFRELANSVITDTSYSKSPLPVDETMTNMEVSANSTATKTTGNKKVLRGKRMAADSSLVRHALKNTRARKADLTTPLVGAGNAKFAKKQQLTTPMITPKFDTRKPLTSAREPKHGETLVSLAGSPVVKAQPDQPNDDSHLVSISLLPQHQQTILGGRLFLDEGMSPNTLLQRKQIIEEAVHAINCRLDELNSQISTGSNLEDQ